MRDLGYEDEPQQSGAIVAVHYGDYRRLECWVSSGSNVGNWYCLGNEFGVPRHDGHALPVHPTWTDVLARGPVTLMSPGDEATYAAGWANGRRRMLEQIEELSDDD